MTHHTSEATANACALRQQRARLADPTYAKALKNLVDTIEANAGRLSKEEMEVHMKDIAPLYRRDVAYVLNQRVAALEVDLATKRLAGNH
jgi:hypothetical protein